MNCEITVTPNMFFTFNSLLKEEGYYFKWNMSESGEFIAAFLKKGIENLITGNRDKRGNLTITYYKASETDFENNFNTYFN